MSKRAASQFIHQACHEAQQWSLKLICVTEVLWLLSDQVLNSADFLQLNNKVNLDEQISS